MPNEEKIAANHSTKSKSSEMHSQTHTQKDFLVSVRAVRKLEIVKTEFLQWSQSVTYHCMPKIFKHNTPFLIRLLWTCVFLTFTGFTGYILAQNVIAYYEYNVVSTILVVNEKPTAFPVVTICLANPFTTSHAHDLIKQQFVDYFNYSLDSLVYSQTVANLRDLTEYLKMLVNSPKYGDLNRAQLGFNLIDILFSCKFNDADCDVNADFHWIFHYDYGNCYQFNSGYNRSNHRVAKLKETIFEGKKNGLSFTFGPVVNANSIPIPEFAVGVKVFITNQSTVPSYFDTALSIEAGKETSIAVQRTISMNFPSPYSECTDLTKGLSSQLYNFIASNTNESYSQKNCFYLCFQRMVIETCHCYFTAFPSLYAEYSPCINSTQYKCFLNFYGNFKSKQSAFSQRCSADCPLECESIAYDLTVSSMDYPSRELYDLFVLDASYNATASKYGVDLSTYDLYKEYYYSLNVFYPKTQYTLINETPQMTVVSLLSSLGGSLGMFLGFSVFSFFEVFELLFQILFTCLVKK